MGFVQVQHDLRACQGFRLVDSWLEACHAPSDSAIVVAGTVIGDDEAAAGSGASAIGSCWEEGSCPCLKCC